MLYITDMDAGVGKTASTEELLSANAIMQIDTTRDLGLRIRDQRQMLRMSQAELARSVGASRYWVIRMEQGSPGAEVGLVLKALRVLGLAMEVRTRSPRADPGREHDEGQPPVLDLAAIIDRARDGAP